MHKKALKQAGVGHTILNHSRTIKIVISLLCLILKHMHSRDITILIVLLWFSIVHYSACFSAFLRIYFRPYSSWKFLIFKCTCLLTFFHMVILKCILHHNCERLNYIWEQSIHCCSLFAMFTPLHSSTNQELFEKHVRNQSSHCKKYDSAARPPVIVWNWSIHCLSLSAMLDLLHSSVNQEVFKKHLCNKVATMKNTDNFLLRAKEAITCNHQINAFHCLQRWMEHKGGHWLVPVECIARTAVCQKAPLGLKQCRTVKKSSP